MLALALIDQDERQQARALAAEMAARRTPPKWRKIHTNVDRAAAALRHLN